MQNDIESKERKQTNQEIASQLQFIVFLSGNINIIKQLHGILQRHLSNVMLLLRSYPEHNIQEWITMMNQKETVNLCFS